jgi:hypothetical protein
MKNLMFLFIFSFLGFIACDSVNHGDCDPQPVVEPTCIQAKIEAIRTANRDFTSVKRYTKNNESFWLFDNGSAFDAPQYMLNAACDTVCTWCFCPTRPPCQLNFNLGDSTAVVIWKK